MNTIHSSYIFLFSFIHSSPEDSISSIEEASILHIARILNSDDVGYCIHQFQELTLIIQNKDLSSASLFYKPKFIHKIIIFLQPESSLEQKHVILKFFFSIFQADSHAFLNYQEVNFFNSLLSISSHLPLETIEIWMSLLIDNPFDLVPLSQIISFFHQINPPIQLSFLDMLNSFSISKENTVRIFQVVEIHLFIDSFRLFRTILFIIY
jgi:hypothetical protein